ncbi:MAG: tRNA lysidine(34) synthetase TilS [Candidatus Omnitrophica bacterium CG11_big_fil_rev_8_21_14_0_20_45_26]|uniref:tRNA(Ile)-lysidine synthase n=1 Tax=Candidatus Abzuiibacterium crystallinum TaxID=1974748 RepID=A0A2H0LKN1_9BACT|nr:MAG: tRNA lysidine(34) synthetase TilS [Candidatus Omnitrophica bacterium CG11_big_fil_rev_8_21_14_0_20_45_26]PIW63943.1 MAG: tRNA lysidine(34) synthetase TilS [Candidatus Omnitrophica bacterium CG12_big_fil_rev_8_21_14_0_65_45_16]
MIEKAFQKTLNQYHMLARTKRLWVAISGGPDSTALLHLILPVARKENLSLGLVHVNHGLRGKEAHRDQKAVRQLAKSLGLPVWCGSVDVKRQAKQKKLSIEEAARDLRYDFFIKHARQNHIDTIALGHTLDDQAETVFMRFLTGAGLQGLGGSRPVFHRDGIRFIRPLIKIPKETLLQFLRKKKISFQSDSSNQDTRFLRNMIRHKIMPLLESLKPGSRKTLARLPETIHADLDFVQAAAKKQYDRLAVLKEGAVSFPRTAFQKLPPAIQFRLIQSALHQMGISEFAFCHWQSFESLFNLHRNFELNFPGPMICRVNESTLQLSRPRAVQKKRRAVKKRLSLNQRLPLSSTGAWIACDLLAHKPRQLKRKKEIAAVMDKDKLEFPLQLRTRLPGDRFTPLGQSVSMKLKDYLIRHKVPREWRDQILLVLSRGEIVWVGGVGMSDKVKVVPETKSCIALRLGPSFPLPALS